MKRKTTTKRAKAVVMISIVSSKKVPRERIKSFIIDRWWVMLGSNQRPLQCDCSALSTELITHYRCLKIVNDDFS